MTSRWIAVAGAALLMAGCNTSYNYFEEEKDPATNAPFNAFGVIMGLARNDEPKIDYKARAPLAMPPSSAELPPPETGDVKSAAGVDWPDDPDVLERERIIANNAKGETALAPTERLAKNSGSGRLSPEEIQAGRLEGAGLTTEPDPDLRQRLSDSVTYRLSPRQLAKKFLPDGSEGEVFSEDGKPVPREYLVEPPDEYRTPAATAAIPDPDEIEHSKWFKDRMYRPKDNRPPRMQK